MPPFPFDLDPEDNVFDEVFAEPGQSTIHLDYHKCKLKL
jgi:hypothetical protein